MLSTSKDYLTLQEGWWSISNIFVFGSNLSGYHNKGAALEAKLKHGAVQGVGFGRTGNSYAIPTKGNNVKTILPNYLIKAYVDDFIEYAKSNSNLTFLLTRVGCGYAKKTDEEMAKMFIGIPNNVKISSKWSQWLENETWTNI